MSLRMRLRDREPIGMALRRFKKQVERSDLIREARKHSHYEKPSEWHSHVRGHAGESLVAQPTQLT